MKKILVVLFLILGFFYFSLPALAADATVYISPSSQTVGNNCAVPVDVMLDTGGDNSSGADIIINYDPNKLSVNSLQEAALYYDYLTVEDVPDQGKIVIQAVNKANEYFMTTAGIAEKYATINFQTKGLGTANITFKFNGVGDTTDTNITGDDGVDLLGSTSAGTIIVEDGAACPGDSPTATPTPDDDDDGDDDNGVGSDDLTTPTPTTYTAPVSGSTTNTIAISIAGTIFLLSSAAFAWLKK